jgi:hypothetical protein
MKRPLKKMTWSILYSDIIRPLGSFTILILFFSLMFYGCSQSCDEPAPIRTPLSQEGKEAVSLGLLIVLVIFIFFFWYIFSRKDDIY